MLDNNIQQKKNGVNNEIDELKTIKYYSYVKLILQQITLYNKRKKHNKLNKNR